MCAHLETVHVFGVALEQLLRLQLDDVMDEHQRVGARRLAATVAATAKVHVAAAAAVAVNVTVAMGTVGIRLTVAAFTPGRREG